MKSNQQQTHNSSAPETKQDLSDPEGEPSQGPVGKELEMDIRTIKSPGQIMPIMSNETNVSSNDKEERHHSKLDQNVLSKRTNPKLRIPPTIDLFMLSAGVVGFTATV